MHHGQTSRQESVRLRLPASLARHLSAKQSGRNERCPLWRAEARASTPTRGPRWQRIALQIGATHSVKRRVGLPTELHVHWLDHQMRNGQRARWRRRHEPGIQRCPVPSVRQWHTLSLSQRPLLANRASQHWLRMQAGLARRDLRSGRWVQTFSCVFNNNSTMFCILYKSVSQTQSWRNLTLRNRAKWESCVTFT